MKFYAPLLLLGLLALTTPANADDSDRHGYIAVVVENDVFASETDRHFSSGVRFDWMPKQDPALLGLRDLMRRILPVDEYASSRMYFSLGQDMHTPEDLRVVELVETDTPYAGWMYVTVGMVRQNS